MARRAQRHIPRQAAPRVALSQLNAALALHLSGQLDHAERIYRQVLAVDASNADALHLLGQIEHQRGKTESALALVRRAIKAGPRIAIYHNTLGEVLRQQGFLDEAVAAYRHAINLNRRFGEAMSNLGSVLNDQGKLNDAVAVLRQAVAAKPDFAPAHNNLGIVLFEQKDYPAAIASYRRAIALDPNLSAVHNNLGNALRAEGHLDKAAECFGKAISFKPDYSEALSNLGAVLTEQRRLDDAIVSIERAIAFDPGFAEAYSNLGTALFLKGAFADAVAVYRKAIALKPDHAAALQGLGNALMETGATEEAIRHMHRSFAIDPEFDSVFMHIINAAATLCDWRDLGSFLDSLAARVAAIVAADKDSGLASLAFLAFVYPYVLRDKSLHKTVLKGAARYVERQKNAQAAGIRFTHPTRESRLRIGYVSPDFGDHPIGHVTLPVYRLHDRGRFEVFAYSLQDRPAGKEPYVDEIRASVDHFVDASPLSYVETARRIHADGIHLLVDLTGYMRLGRPIVFAMRPAPIQVYWQGHGGSLGADYMDYVIADPTLAPAAEDGDYVEKLARLPNSFSSADRPPIAALATTRAEQGLPERGAVFCAFNNPLKIDPLVFDRWAAILRAVPDSVLWLSSGRGGKAAENLSTAAEQRGIDPKRLVFATRLADKSQHLARHALADLFLDTFHFNASTTALDALWAGLPIVTLHGDNFYSRIGASYLSAVDLPELICQDPDSYQLLAIDLAKQPEKLAELKRRLAMNRLSEPLFDAPRFVRHLESAFEHMWRRHHAGLAPESFDVPVLGQPAGSF